MKITDFYGKKILVIVPHQDDEINLAGGLIASVAKKSEVYVLYTTSGNFLVDARVRQKEARKSCEVLGVKAQNVVFLGYPDQPYDQDTHLYNSDVWEDREHNKFRKKDLVKDIKEQLLKIKPDIIVCVDLDFHPDHIMTSLCFEKAMGEILHSDVRYFPVVLKGFTYENAYHGPEDFETGGAMYFEYKKDGRLVSDPYYSKDNAIDVKFTDEKVLVDKLNENLIYKAIKAHRSQALVERAFRIMNPNVMYWQRETHNLINEAKVEVSSGQGEYLNDFLINDTSNVLGGDKRKIVYDKSIWMPENSDKKKEVKISFAKPTYVEIIKVYHGNNGQAPISSLKIITNGKNIDYKTNGLITCAEVGKRVSSIKIVIESPVVRNGFSEIEVLEELNAIGADSKISDEQVLEISSMKWNKIKNKLNTFFVKVYRRLFIR